MGRGMLLTPDPLFAESFAVSTKPYGFDHRSIRIEPIDVGRAIRYQAMMSKAIWRPAPGRKLAFLVHANIGIIGQVFLASPVINLGVRDAYLDLPKDAKARGAALRSYCDLSVCVSAQPFGWHWNGGKLMALLATTLGDYWLERYGDELLGVCTTSLWGRGSQYNRVYKFLGYTKGYGHQHITDAEYQQMLEWMRANNVPIPSCKFGEGSNPRMRRIAAYRKASGDKAVTLVHGQKRGVYYHAAVDPSRRGEVIERWHERWGAPRYERTKHQEPPYSDGLSSKDAAEPVPTTVDEPGRDE